MPFRTADVVRHLPSGQVWVVAYADQYTLICCGWPESSASPADCELEYSATDEAHWKLVEQVAKHPHSSRGSRCWALLEARREKECLQGFAL